MVTIRLQRGGAKKRPFYQLVVADSRRATVVSLKTSVSSTQLHKVKRNVFASILSALNTGLA